MEGDIADTGSSLLTSGIGQWVEPLPSIGTGQSAKRCCPLLEKQRYCRHSTEQSAHSCRLLSTLGNADVNSRMRSTTETLCTPVTPISMAVGPPELTAHVRE